MALRFVDGFDHYVTADFLKKWTSTNGTVTINAGTGRRGTASFQVTGNSRYLSLALDNQPTWSAGMAFRYTTGASFSAVPILALLDGVTTQVDVRVTPTGTLQATRSGTVLGTTAAALALNSYVYLELFTTIHFSAGVVIVRVNGAEVLTLSAQNTSATGTAYANLLRIGTLHLSELLGTVDIDDVYLCDGTGSAPHNTLLGDCRVDTLLPASDGTSQQWTPSTPGTHYTLVDEAAPNTTDYVASSTVGHRDTYGMQDLTALTGTIYGVQLNLAALKSDAGARSVKPLLLSGASEALGPATALGTSQTYTRHIQTTDPATAAAWTEAAVNSVQCGAEVA